MNGESLIEELSKLLLSLPSPGKSGIAFSGGLDSSILAYIFRDDIQRGYVVGFTGSRDVQNAVESSEILGLDLEIIEIDEEYLLSSIEDLLRILPELNAVEVSFELPQFIVFRNAREERIVTGQGADEIFGGYAKYMENPYLMDEDVKRVLHEVYPRERRMAEACGKTLLAPYLDERIVDFARRVPVDMKIREGVRKWILREAARRIGVPESIVERKKKAAQYGSGIWRTMRRMARKEGFTVEEWLNVLREK